MIKKKPALTTVRSPLIPLPRAWLGFMVLVIMVGIFLTTPFLLWSYNIERAGRLLERGLMWPEPRLSDSLPQLGNPDALKAAEEYLAAAIYWRQAHPYAYRLKAYSYIAQGEWEEAVTQLEQAEKFAPRHPLLTWEKGLVYEHLWQEGTTSAHSGLIEAWKKLNFDAATFQTRAREASGRAKWEDSLKWNARALELGANLESAIAYGRYLLLQKQGEESAAQAKFEEAISYDTGWLSEIERFQAWSRWGGLLFDEKKYSQAEGALQQAIAVFPENSRLQNILSENYRLLGLTQLALAKPEAALESFQKAIEINKKNTWAYVSYGQLLYELEPTQITQSSQAFKTALRLKSDDLQLWETLILYWRRAQEMEQVEALCQLGASEEIAAEMADICQTTDKQTSSDWYYQSQILSEAGKTEQATEALEQAITLNQGWFNPLDRFQAWDQWGRSLSEQKRYPEAEEAFQTAINSTSKEVDNSLLSQSYRNLALTQIELGKQNAALENFQQAIENDNQNLWAYVSYGQLLYELEPTRAAETTQAFETALSLASEDVELWRNLILYWHRAQEIEQAEVLCQLAAKEEIAAEVADICQTADKQTSSDWYYQSQALSKAGQIEQATAALEQAITLNEGWFNPVDRFQAWYQWGRLLFDHQRYSEAEEALQLALSESTEQIDNSLLSGSYRYLALTQIQLGKQEAALENLAQAIELDNQNLWAYIDYGQQLYQLEPTRAAETTQAFETALSLASEDVELWRNLILYWRRAQEMEQVKVLCQAAAAEGIATEEVCQGLDGSETSGDRYYEYQALLEEGNNQEAYKALQRAIELDQSWFSPVEQFQAWYQWGRRLSLLEEYAEAERILNETIERYPEDAGAEAILSEVYRFMAISQLRQGKQSEALQNFEQSRQWNNKNVWAHINYGQTLYLVEPQRISETDSALATALALRENDPSIWRNLINFWVNQNQKEKAAELCQQVAGKEFADKLSELCESSDE